MGTGEVTRYLGRYGSARVAKGVLVSPIPPYLLQTDDNPDGVPQGLFDGFAQAARADTPAWMKGFLDNFYNIDTLRGTLVSDQAYQASWNLAVTASATAAVACIGTWTTDFRDDLPKIDVPMLVIHGDADQVLPLDKTGQPPAGPDQGHAARRGRGRPRTPSPGPTPTRSTPPCSTSCAPEPPATQTTTTEGATMSNHFSADNLKFPGDDRRLDLTDLFVFTSPEDPGKTVLIIDSNPTSAPPPIPAPTTGPEFYPGAVYRINIDTDGDAHADVAFTFTFSEYENGTQTGTAWYATGPQARQPEPAGEVLAESFPVSFDGMAQPVQAGPGSGCSPGCAATRSSPTSRAPCTDFKWTGHDDFAGNNVDSIALEVPDEMLGPGPVIGVWASISLRRDGVLVQMDRGGNPTINPFINPDGEKNLYNARQPADDVANYLGPWSKILENGGYSPEQAKDGSPAGAARHPPLRPHQARHLPQRPHPHRRRLQHALCLADPRQGPPTGLKPHDDLLTGFPYLGPPNP